MFLLFYIFSFIFHSLNLCFSRMESANELMVEHFRKSSSSPVSLREVVVSNYYFI